MRDRSIRGIAATVFAVALFGVPAITEAVPFTVTSIVVTEVQSGNTVVWCNVGAGCANQIWTLPVGGAVINEGQSAVFTQTGTGGQGGNYNFDTSDAFGTTNTGAVNNTPCDSTHPCTISVAINGATQLASNNGILTNFSADTGGNSHNEARNYDQGQAPLGPFGPALWSLSLGYADNAHLVGTTCADSDTDCQPAPGALLGASNAGLFFGKAGTTAAGSCVAGGPCYDAGAIRISVPPIPEPASMFLLGSGLMLAGRMVRRKSRARKESTAA